MDWTMIEHFKPKELASPDDLFSANRMNGRFMARLDALRQLFNRPFTINSGIRTPEHNKKVGGAPASAHLDGLAVDISTARWTVGQKADLITYARMLGFTGIGVAKTFIHLDMKPRVASWIYAVGGTRAIPLGTETKHI